MSLTPKYRRVLVKVSGEALMGDGQFGIDVATVDRIAQDVAEAAATGIQLCMVVGGGNIFRGLAGSAKGIDRATADYMGMLATVMNALALQDALRQLGAAARVQSALNIEQIVEPYIRPKALRYLEEGKVVIFAGGTGNPFFTTDTTAALRALEIGAECILMAKNGVEGVLDADPRIEPDARLIPKISHMEAIERGLRVMDTTALTLCMDNNLPIFVFNMSDDRNIRRLLDGERIGTMVVTDDPS